MVDPSNITNSKAQHRYSDKDSSALALHHTLGKKKYQASPGDHIHDGTSSLRLGTIAATSSTAAQTTLTVETVVLSLSNSYKSDRLYRVSYSFRVQMNGGTSPFAPFTRIRRTNAAGTLIYDPGATAAITSNNIHIHGVCYLKRTGTTDTTQTIALTISRNVTGAPTSVDVEANATAPSMLLIEEIGPASDFSGAIEVPTA